MITVSDILKGKSGEVWSIEPDATVYQALELMSAKNVGALPVVEKGELVGMFSERDYARKCILMGRHSRATLVSELMSSPVLTTCPTVSIRECLAIMTHRQVRHLPVIEEDRIVGLVSIGDIGKAIISEQEVFIHDLEGYITGNTYCR